MRRRFHALALLLGAACSTEDGSEEPAELSFDWGERGDAQVTATKTEDGHRSRSRFRLLFQPDQRAGGQVIERVDLEVLELGADDGESEPEEAPDYAELDVHGRTFPRLVVDAAGRPTGFLDYEVGIDRFSEELRRAGVEEGRIEDLRDRLLQPAVKQAAETTVVGDWSLWVTSWTGYPAEEGWERTRELPVDTGIPGVVLPTSVTVRCAEVVEDAGARCARYERETRYDEEALTRLLAAQPGFFPGRIPPENLLAARRIDRAEALIEIEGMRPHRVRTETTFEVRSSEPAESARIVSSQTFDFLWPKDP